MTILIATVAAFLLVPAAQAFANGTLKVNVVGTGSGEATSVGGLGAYEEFEGMGNFYEGSPAIECSGPGSTGTCETEMVEEPELEPGVEGIALRFIADSGSELVGYDEGAANCFVFTETICWLGVPNGFGDAEIIVTFCLEGQTEEECETPPVEGPELTVAKEGTGSGTVVSNPAGIECGGKCTTAFEEGTKVTLTASPSAGSTFVSWKGCEKGGVNGRQCTVTMDKAKTVNAKFLTAYDVTVNRVGSGLGKVSSSPGGVLCLSNCASTSASFKEGTSVTLSAAPTKNYVFTEWTGDCSGSGTCSLGSLSSDKTVGAKFTPVAQHNLTLTKSGGGNGTAKSNVAGINCGATCSSMAAAYFQGTVVELTATPGKGSSFGGWSGGGCSGTGTCTVTMSAAKSVTAEFK